MRVGTTRSRPRSAAQSPCGHVLDRAIVHEAGEPIHEALALCRGQARPHTGIPLAFQKGKIEGAVPSIAKELGFADNAEC